MTTPPFAACATLALEPLAWARGHPIAALLLVACCLVWAARAYFLYTKSFLERFEELPERRSLSTIELVVLGRPAALDAARLAEVDRRYRVAGRGATLVAALVVAVVMVRGALYGAPSVLAMERVDALCTELEVELEADRLRSGGLATRFGAAGERGAPSARVRELSAELRGALETLDARGRRGEALTPQEQHRRRLAAGTLALAERRFADGLDLVGERELEQEAQATERQVERELALALSRARSLRGLGQTERALGAYERALALRPARHDLRLERAGALVASGRLDAARAELDACVAHYASRERDGGAGRLAAARLLRAYVFGAEDRPEEARTELDAVLSLLQEKELFPEGPARDADLARAFTARALCAEDLGELAAALSDLERAVALRRALLARGAGGSLDDLLALADALVDRARVARALRDLAVTLDDLDEAIAIRGEALHGAGRSELAGDLARARSARGAARREGGDARGARTDLDAAVDALAASSESADSAGGDLDLAVALVERARLELLEARPERAVADLAAAAVALDRAVARGAPAERLEAWLAATANARGRALEALGRAAPALAEHDRAIGLHERRVARRRVPPRVRELAEALLDRSAARMTRGAHAGAAADFARAVDLLDGVHACDAGGETALELAELFALSAGVQRSTGDRRRALADLERSIELLEGELAQRGGEPAAGALEERRRQRDELRAELAVESPDAAAPASEPADSAPAERETVQREPAELEAPDSAPRAAATPVALAAPRPERAETHERRARAHCAAGAPGEAEREYGLAIAMRARLLELDPGPAGRAVLAEDHLARAVLRAELGRLDAAADDGESALALLAELAREEESPAAALALARAHRRCVTLRAAQDDLERAVRHADAAVELARGVCEAAPGAEHARELAGALGERGALWARRARFALARRDFDERVELLRVLAREAPRDPAPALELARALRGRALTAFNERDPEAALRDLDEAQALLERLVAGGRNELAGELEDVRQERRLVAGADDEQR